MVKTISPSGSTPVVSTAAPTSTMTTRVIQIGGSNRYVRAAPTMTTLSTPGVVQQQPIAIRTTGQVRQAQTVTTTTSSGTPTLATLPHQATTTAAAGGIPLSHNPIIVRTTSSPNSAVQSAVWPSQPLTTIQLQDLFQRPRPPQPLTLSQGVQGGTRSVQGTPIVRTILVPRTLASGSQQQQTAQIVSQHHVNTPLPNNFQLPSEPVPISLQVLKYYKVSNIFQGLFKNYVDNFMAFF